MEEKKGNDISILVKYILLYETGMHVTTGGVQHRPEDQGPAGDGADPLQARSSPGTRIFFYKIDTFLKI